MKKTHALIYFDRCHQIKLILLTLDALHLPFLFWFALWLYYYSILQLTTNVQTQVFFSNLLKQQKIPELSFFSLISISSSSLRLLMLRSGDLIALPLTVS